MSGSSGLRARSQYVAPTRSRRGRRPGWMRARPGPPGGPSPIRLPGRLAGRRDVLVDVEHVVRVVALLDLGEPVVVAAVRRPDPVLALAHQEVDVAASRRGRVQLLPVVAGPLRDQAGVGGIRVDADDDAAPPA